MGKGELQVKDRAARLGVVAALLLTGSVAFAAPGEEKARHEIEDNVGKIRANIKTIGQNLDSIDENLRAGQKNVGMIEQELAAKSAARDGIVKDLERSENALAEAKRSEKDFRDALDKDLNLLETSKKEVEITKKRLARLEENVNILEDNIEIDQENIEKIVKAREVWEKNTRSYRTTLQELDQLQKDLDGQLKGQRQILEKNQREKERWSKLLEAQQKDLEEIEAEYRKIQDLNKKPKG